MMGQGPLFECVPNFSEGRRPDVLNAIQRAAEVPGVAILGMDSDPDHHRSVLTLVGAAEPLLEAVYRSIAVAVAHIDLSHHRGIHPRIGAADVVPFVPWRDAEMGDAVQLARILAERVARDLEVPVYLYEKAAQTPAHVNLRDVRRGGFEGLAARMADDPPDFGPHQPHPSAGASAVGARRLLIAFNVYLNTQDIGVARAVAKAVRGSSGGLVGVKALAMDTQSQGRVQVSMNLVDYRTTSLPRAMEMVRQEASRFGVAVADTELVGLMPYEALEDVARYYLQMPRFQSSRVLETALGQHQ